MIYIYISFVVIGDEYKTFQELHVMYRIYHPILKFYQMLRVVPRHNPIQEIYHNPIRNSYRMIRTIPSVIPAYPTSVQTSVNQALRQPSRTHQFKSSHPPKALYTYMISDKYVHWLIWKLSGRLRFPLFKNKKYVVFTKIRKIRVSKYVCNT